MMPHTRVAKYYNSIQKKSHKKKEAIANNTMRQKKERVSNQNKNTIRGGSPKTVIRG